LILTPFFDPLIIFNTWSVAVTFAGFFFAGAFFAIAFLVVFALAGFAALGFLTAWGVSLFPSSFRVL